MMSRKATAGALLAILLMADATLGFTPVSGALPFLGDNADQELQEFREQVENTYAGGGTQILFQDDFSPLTARYIAKQGNGIPAYHGGALPEDRDGPQRWSQDLYRWGSYAERGEQHGWSRIDAGAMTFGSPETGYPPNALSELVSPVIDLRDLPSDLNETSVRLSTSPDPVGPPPGDCTLTPAHSQWCEAQATSKEALEAEFEEGRRQQSIPSIETSAVLQLRHAYDFYHEGQTVDGGRLVATVYDEDQGQWLEWMPLAPTDTVLQVGAQEFRVRGNHTGTPVSVSASQLSNGGTATASGSGLAISATVDESGNVTPTLAPEPKQPHLYQDNIRSSDGRWTNGFSGKSQGYVESLFDLSPFAGALIRIGFQTATHNTDDDSPIPRQGWAIDEVVVHSSGQEGVKIIGLAEPGDGSLVRPGIAVSPSVVVQNTAREPTEIVIHSQLDGLRETTTASLSIGPLGRANIPLGTTQTHESAGLHRLEVQIRPGLSGTESLELQGQGLATDEAQFHYLTVEQDSWAIEGVDFHPLIEQDNEPPQEGQGRFLHRQQPAVIKIHLENQGTVPTEVKLGGTEHQGDLRVALVDESGNEYGTVTPQHASPIQLPISRFIGGSSGDPQAARMATWLWSGTDVARSLELQVLRTDAGTGQEHLIRDGGPVLVQTISSPPLDNQFNNPWTYDAGDAACTRVTRHEGQDGVIRCPEESQILSPSRRLFDIDLVRGQDLVFHTTYRGGPVNVSFQTHSEEAPEETPPEEARWDLLGNLTLPHAQQWTTLTLEASSLAANFTGHLRFSLTALGAPFDLDEAQTLLRLQNSKGIQVDLPILGDRFDAVLEPSRDVVKAVTDTGLVLLNASNPEPAEVLDSQIPSGGSRVIQDGMLVKQEAINLQGVARPELRFSHWIAPGYHGQGIIEVATVSSGTTESLTGPQAFDWEEIARFRTPNDGKDSLAETVRLWDYAGESILIQFRFHMDESVLSASATRREGTNPLLPGLAILPPVTGDPDPVPAGWLVEGIQVNGWSQGGPTTVHEAAPGFPEYAIRAGMFVGDEITLSQQNCWSGSPPTLDSDCRTDHGASALVVDPVRLNTMRTPILEITHSGHLGKTGCSVLASFPAMDFEYRTGGPGSPWYPATPTTVPRAMNGSIVGWERLGPNDVSPSPLLDPATLQPNQRPFGGIHETQNGCNANGALGGQTDLQYSALQQRFDLERFTSSDEPVQFRLATWVERAENPAKSGGSGAVTPFGDLDITEVSISEERHLVDAAITQIKSATDDRERLEELQPGISEQLGLTDEVLIAPKSVAKLIVEVTNEGSTPLDVDVSLRGVGTGENENQTLDITWLEERNGQLIPTGLPIGTVHVQPGASTDVVFRADFLDQPPGAYRLTARADPTNGVDTAPRNDLRDQDVRVLPFRAIKIDASQSSVAPYAASSQALRTIQALITNEGNVEEGEVHVAADVVRMTGLSEFESLQPPILPSPLKAQEFSLSSHGDGRFEAKWELRPADILQGPEDSPLVPGETYAVRIQAAATNESVQTWWNDTKQPLPIRSDGQGLLNLSRAPHQDCRCLLIPFIVEKVLYATDLSSTNTTTVLPGDQPDPIDDWEATTLLEGTPVDPDRTDIPRWTPLQAHAAELPFSGPTTGKIWALPSYQGLERVEQALTSPTMPAHIIDDQSRSILSLRYASEIPADQVVLETRHRIAGTWTEWRPADDLRMNRVAIILAHDFPEVTPTGLVPSSSAYSKNALRSHHEEVTPSWYGDPLDLAKVIPQGYADPEADKAPVCFNQGGRLCLWSPPLSFESQGNEDWLDALNQTLNGLSDTFGTDNIGLFSTVDSSQQEGPGIGEWEDNSLIYRVQTDAGDLRFPIRDLDHLGLEIDRYGAILLAGDGVTQAYANQSQALVSMALGPGDNALLPPDGRAIEHNQRVFAILNAAASAGVRVIGSLGPAAASLALSGVAPSATMAVWQTHPAMPNNPRAVNTNLFCTAIKPSPTGVQYELPDDEKHPLDSCQHKINLQVKPDPGDPHNYYFISPYDAQSLALQDFVNEATVGQGFVLPEAGLNTCDRSTLSPTTHPLLAGGGGCTWFADNHRDRAGQLEIVSAARPDPVTIERWLTDIVSALEDAGGGFLPPGGWQDLPASLSFPFGGTFQRALDGGDIFNGAPSQFRIRIQSDETTEGHGAFAVDRTALLGTNRTAEVGIEVVAPSDLESYTPGRQFEIQLQATNKGTTPFPGGTVDLTTTQWMRGLPGECTASLPTKTDIQIPPLAPGQQSAIPVAPPYAQSVWNDGIFPTGESCPAPAAQNNWFNFTAVLDVVDFPDSESRDNHDKVTVRGREVTILDETSILAIEVTPTLSVHHSQSDLIVQADIKNQGSGKNTFVLDATLEPARPLACERHDTPGKPADENIYGCDRTDSIIRRVALGPGAAATTIDRGATGTITAKETLESLGLEPGIYRIDIRFKTTDTEQKTIVYPPNSQRPLQHWVHILPSSDGEEAREMLPPDGGLAYEAQNLDALSDLATTPTRGQWHESGFLVSSGSVQAQPNGVYAPDSSTRNAQEEPLSHGWRLLECTECQDSTRSVVEWRRSGEASYRPGADPSDWDQSEGNTDDLGHGDFGPDFFTWLPHDPMDQRDDPDRTPYLSLASYNRPELAMLARYDGSPNTAFIVQMQVAGRAFCQENTGNTQCPSNAWTWDTPWLDLMPEKAPVTNPDGVSRVEAEEGQRGGGGGEQPITTWERNHPSNPLAGNFGFWGARSGQHAEDGGWMLLRFPIDPSMQPELESYCQSIVRPDPLNPLTWEATRPEWDPCRYAHGAGNPGHQPNSHDSYVTRPVRFQIAAASYGGDVGQSYFQVADISVGEHRANFLGPQQQTVTMNDAENHVFPVRVTNEGTVPDTFQVTWTPTRGRLPPALGTGGEISLAPDSDFKDPAQALAVPLDSGESEVVWVKISTGILDTLPPGSSQPIPFLVKASSSWNPNQAAEILVDASFRSRAWPDLTTDKLVLGEDDGDQAFVMSVHAPVKPTLSFRNTGTITMGTEADAIGFRLVVEQIDPGTETPIPGTRAVLANTTVAGPIHPYSKAPQDLFVPFPEWVPEQTGVYRLSAEANAATPDAPMPAPERARWDNVIHRDVIVGPVRFADLQLNGLRLIPYDGSCSGEPAERIIAGHSYCLEAQVSNHGLRDALAPRVEFGIGASAPFSAGAPSLSELFPGGEFPAATLDGNVTEVSVRSSPRVLTHPTDGSDRWSLYAEVSSRSIMPNLQDKSVQAQFRVDTYELTIDGLDHTARIAPGTQARLSLNITNDGNAPATPTVNLQEPHNDLRIRFNGPRVLLPEETAAMELVLTASPELNDKTKALEIQIGVKEDPLVHSDHEIGLNVIDMVLPGVTTLSVAAPPGTVQVPTVLDATDSPLAFQWTIRQTSQAVTDPLWEFQSKPFTRNIVDIPLRIDNSTPPGIKEIEIPLQANHGGLAIPLNITVPMSIRPQPSLHTTLISDRINVVAGETARLELALSNTGNVPLEIRLQPTSNDTREITPESQQLHLWPNETARPEFNVKTDNLERVVGDVSINWTATDGTEGNRDVSWRVDVHPARIQIKSTNLDQVNAIAGQPTPISIEIQNIGSSPIDSEILLAMDNALQETVNVHLTQNESRQITLTLAPDTPAQRTITVLARPAGSDIWLSDASAVTVGDVVQQEVTVKDPSSDRFDIPGFHWSLPTLALLGCVFLILRRRPL